jgi:1-acyl-sn-glycerol-3-phosphate acyltransferase
VSVLFFTQRDTEEHRETLRKILLMDILMSLIVWLIGVSFVAITFLLSFIAWLVTYPFDRERAMIHWMLTYESIVLSHIIPIWKINIEGREKAVKGTTYVIISNHQSMLDILLLNCLRYKFTWISKIENMKVPFIGWYLRMADYIVVNRGDEDSKTEMLEKSLDKLKKGVSIMIFPEGTRSLNSEIGFFKRGAFQLALQANVALLPVLIDGTGGILPKHGMIFGTGHKISIRVLDPIQPDTFKTDSPEDLAMKVSIFMSSELKVLRSSQIKR